MTKIPHDLHTRQKFKTSWNLEKKRRLKTLQQAQQVFTSRHLAALKIHLSHQWKYKEAASIADRPGDISLKKFKMTTEAIRQLNYLNSVVPIIAHNGREYALPLEVVL